MTEDKLLVLDEFLKEQGFENNLSNKEKLKILKQIIFTVGVDKDLEELRFVKNEGKETAEEYFNKINNLELTQMQAQGYIMVIKQLERKKRKLKRNEAIQKVKSIFKK